MHTHTLIPLQCSFVFSWYLQLLISSGFFFFCARCDVTTIPIRILRSCVWRARARIRLRTAETCADAQWRLDDYAVDVHSRLVVASVFLKIKHDRVFGGHRHDRVTPARWTWFVKNFVTTKTATTNDKWPVVCVQTGNIALFFTYLRLCFPKLRSKYFCFFSTYLLLLFPCPVGVINNS